MAQASDHNAKIFRVCVTGYGSFNGHLENPAWLSTAPLNGKVLKHCKTEIDPEIVVQSSASTAHQSPSDIHITSFELRVSYECVLSAVGPLHASPPRLPDSVPISGAPPHPNEPFDLILHVGVGSRGGMRIEARARRLGYELRDVDDVLAPIIHPSHLGIKPLPSTLPCIARPLKPYAGIIPKPIGVIQFRGDAPRGIGEGYEGCPREIWNTGINVKNLVEAVRQQGVQHVSYSTDAGLYLCEFLYYASLAQAYRRNVVCTASRAHEDEDSHVPTLQTHPTFSSTGSPPKVLFVHVPPVGEPQSLEEMTFAIEEIIKLVCWGGVED